MSLKAFLVQQSEDDHIVALLVEPAVTLATLLEELSVVSNDAAAQQINELDISCWEPPNTLLSSNGGWKSDLVQNVTEAVIPLLFKRRIRRIFVPERQCTTLRNACTGALLDEARRVFKQSVVFLYGNPVSLRSILSFNQLTDKLVARLDVDVPMVAPVSSVTTASTNLVSISSIPQRVMEHLLVKVCRNERRSARKLINTRRKGNIRAGNIKAIAASLKESSTLSDAPSPDPSTRLPGCYVCKMGYGSFKLINRQLDSNGFKHYKGRLCPKCADLNFRMRSLRADLSGKYGIVTGGRLKMGYEAALRLLRDGCTVVATTRFPVDAAQRYANESDFDSWSTRLLIYSLDLRSFRSISGFIHYLNQTLPHLDILINHAAQTNRRPPEFYGHLLEKEQEPGKYLKSKSAPLIVRASKPYTDSLDAGSCIAPIDVNGVSTTDSTESPHVPARSKSSKNHLTVASPHHFPSGLLDEFGQQIDLRPTNSWEATMADVPLNEMLEVTTINIIGPFLLCQNLVPLMQKSPCDRRFIVNVSSMEGQFGSTSKTLHHPHTNMAKAALNMLTRTAGMEYQSKGIYITSVDTGWVTDELPYHIVKEREKKGIIPPLDCIDGAARMYHPIASGLDPATEVPLFAVLIKDYCRYPW